MTVILQPWHKVATPRKDLREGKSLEAAEFAVHLDQVRDGRAPGDYQDPPLFFERTYLTENLTVLAGEVVRRLSGERSETSAVFNMATQFGGGKTHALTLLYHLARAGPAAGGWRGVNKILSRAGIESIPFAATAVFVGTEFDSIVGRGGDGEPLRKTPWGEIAYQLGGVEAFSKVEEHDLKGIAPGGDVIRDFIPRDKPSLILIDELMNYVSRYRNLDLSNQLYDFLHSLSGVVSGMDRVVLVVSVPQSVIEMTDYTDYSRFKKLLDRVSKAVMISAESDTSEIIRRRLFEWDSSSLTPDGRVVLPKEAVQTCKRYAEWIRANKNNVPGWFPVDRAQDVFEATYPFHPMVLSVFERKWQALPKFQRTRGILRLLALWVSKAYRDSYSSARPDGLIALGTAPLEEPFFRAAVLEQLNEDRLDVAITTDITGRAESHAVRLDEEANAAIKKSRLHRKVATAIFFESNGGQTHGTFSSIGEIRLAVAEPELDIGNVDAVLEALSRNSYFLQIDGMRYWFGLRPNLNKVFDDRKGGVSQPQADEYSRKAIIEVFNANGGIKRIFFPEKSSEIPDQPVLTLVVLSPERRRQEEATLSLVESLTKEHGSSARTFKSALLWALAENDTALSKEARAVLAWESIKDEQHPLQLDDRQVKEVATKLESAKRDLKEAVWSSYRSLALLGKENKMNLIDLGRIHSSAARTLIDLYLGQLKRSGQVEERVSPNFLVRNWPPAFKEWSTKAVRDAFFASPQFPRLINAEAVKETIASGVTNGIFAYVGKSADGKYDPQYFKVGIGPEEIEIIEDMFIVREIPPPPPPPPEVVISPKQISLHPGTQTIFTVQVLDENGKEMADKVVTWSATGGTINNQGMFTAGQDVGTFVVTATVDGVSDSATVTISIGDKPVHLMVSPNSIQLGRGDTQVFSIMGFDRDGKEVPLGQVNWTATGGTIDGSGLFAAGQEEGAFEVSAVSEGIRGSASVKVTKVCLSWSGEVPPQKWVNFYTRVLSKYALRKGLKLSVQVEVSDASEGDKEEMRLALHELGLDDEVEIG
jgi:hypothetical protein